MIDFYVLVLGRQSAGRCTNNSFSYPNLECFEEFISHINGFDE